MKKIVPSFNEFINENSKYANSMFNEFEKETKGKDKSIIDKKAKELANKYAKKGKIDNLYATLYSAMVEGGAYGSIINSIKSDLK